MTDAIDWAALEAGCCTRAAVAEKGCTLCAPKFAAIDRLRAIVEAGDKLLGAANDVCDFGELHAYSLDQAANAYDRARRGEP